MKRRYDVFISYSTMDSDNAADLHSSLTERGARCFMSEKDISAGEKWSESIRENIESSDLMLLLITPNAIRSEWVRRESEAAWILRKRIIAALMFVEPEELSDHLKQFQHRNIETPKKRKELVDEICDLVDFSSFWGPLFAGASDDDDIYVALSAKRPVEYIDGKPTEKPGHTILVSYNEFSGILGLQEELEPVRRRLRFIHGGIRDKPESALRFRKHSNMIVVGSRHANPICEKVFDHHRLRNPPYQFESTDGNIKYIETQGTRFPDPDEVSEDQSIEEDYGIILRATNPFDSRFERKVLVLAGNHGFGTQSAIKYVANRRRVRFLRERVGDEDFIALFKATVDRNEGLDLQILQISILENCKWVLRYESP